MTGDTAQAGMVILMAVRNGAAHLAEQLGSFAAQGDPDWDLIISDDGSDDASLTVAKDYAAAWKGAGKPHQVTLLEGPRQGFVANFFHLLCHIPETARYAALSDQDDVWFPEKLTRAKVALSALPKDRPALYCARSQICDDDLNPLRLSTLFDRPAGFRNALVQSIGGGNTMVLNRAAIDLVQAAIPEAETAAVHDWWLYQIVTACGGVIHSDPEPVLHYRQHEGNAIGANTSAQARIRRILFILGRRFAGWNEINLKALSASRHRFTPEARRVLDYYIAARRGPPWSRLRALRAAGVYRQSRPGTIALYAACLIGRL
ncbi:MAG: glycosyltransferase family 2 protein [Pseudorhodobacter sp.]